MFATKRVGPLKILKRYEFNTTQFLLLLSFNIITSGKNVFVFLVVFSKNIDLTDKIVATFRTYELGVIIVPAIGNGRAVCQNKYIFRSNTFTEIIGSKSLAKTWLSIPKKFRSLVLLGDFHQLMIFEIVSGSLCGIFLFLAKFVFFHAFHFRKDAVILAELEEMKFRDIPICFEPFRSFGVTVFGIHPFNTLLVCKVFVKIIIPERSIVVFKQGAAGPFNVGFRIGGTGLLVDSFLYGSVHVLAEFDFGVADFDPAIMRFVVRGGIGVNGAVYRPHGRNSGNLFGH